MNPTRRVTGVAALVVLCIGLAHAQDSRAQADRAAARIKALQAEADRLAAQARTVFGDLRRLEVQRELKQEELGKAEADLSRVTMARDNAADHVQVLEATRIAQTPGVKERLVELSKRGRAGYIQLLLSSDDVRSIGRMARGVAAVAELDRVRLETHRRTLAAEQQALRELEQQRQAVAASERDALKARTELDRAVAARNRMIEDLDARRDLAAQYVAELQQAQRDIERTLAATPDTTVPLPLRPFKGDLPWPVAGAVASRFGRVASGRFGTAIVRNGIEVTAAEGVDARAVHEGTVAYAAPFTGFGTLVIVDHGQSSFTLYGHLQEATVAVGSPVSRGSVVGRVGVSPAGSPGLYFEVRIDGRPVDPLEWLRRPSR